MGKKSRQKQLRSQQQGLRGGVNFTPQAKAKAEPQHWLEKVLFYLVALGACLALATPLVFKTQFYFPYVGPKGWFLMGVCQLTFFSWVLLAFYFKQYRPKLSRILIVFSLFLAVLILSTLLGADPSRSFYSKFERMTGLLMWLHLFGLFLALSSTFKKLAQWRKLFYVSLGLASLIVVMFLIVEFGNASYLAKNGKDIFTFTRGGGVTLGNSSFLGTYLVFSIFFAVYLFFTQKKLWLKIALASFVALSLLSLYRAGARAATLAAVGGFFLMFLMYLAFHLKPKYKAISQISRFILFASIALYLLSVFLLFIPFEGNFVRTRFAVAASSSRFVNWEMALKGFFDRPLLGWGLENYDILFTKYFNPCLFTQECGGEIWFDRTHNIVLDVLSQTGALGLFSYLLLFVFVFVVLIKKFFKEKTIGFWLFATFTVLPIAYFTQNLTVFDMPASLVLFVSLLAFIAAIEGKKPDNEEKVISSKQTLNLKRKWVMAPVALLFLIFFWQFVVNVAITDSLIIEAVRTVPSEELAEKIKNEQGDKAFVNYLDATSKQRVEIYQKALETSSLGKYQARDFFVETSQEVIRNYAKHFPAEQVKTEINFLESEMQKSIFESPLDFRAYLKLAQVYNLFAVVGVDKLALAKETEEKAKMLSPNNQQIYWTISQTYLYGSEKEQAVEAAKTAIALEPSFLRSYTIAYEIAQMVQDELEMAAIKNMAISYNPDWASAFEQ
ncbi:O-antigen ligase family protein [Candidatus Parcubacteria bacterium]|nr:O-antigen ligase family protein [Candidatus Parcubacteria bacterium]